MRTPGSTTSSGTATYLDLSTTLGSTTMELGADIQYRLLTGHFLGFLEIVLTSVAWWCSDV